MFKLYQNKSSLDKRRSRFVQGGTSDFNDKYVSWWERDISFLAKDDPTDEEFTITREFEFLPDNIAGEKYNGRTDFDWVILQYNNIVDIMEELAAGKKLMIPSYQRVITALKTHAPINKQNAKS